MSITTTEKPAFSFNQPIDSLRKLREFKTGQQALVAIVEEATQETSFPVLDKLAREASQNPDLRPVLDALIDSTAELLLDKTIHEEAEAHKYTPSLTETWSALRAWDTTRNEATAKLAVHVLNHFRGEGQQALVAAYISARDQSIPFDDALDAYNQTSS